MQKVISAPSVQFKGEGWYVTDYKKQPKDKPAADKQPAKDAPADAACTKPDCGTKEGGSK
jgi:hypothetical protein